MLNIIALLVFTAIGTLLIWIGFRVWRSKNSLLKWGAVSLTALLATVDVLLVVLTISGLVKLHARSAPIPDIKIAGTTEQIRRGQAIANSFCDACHSRTSPLTGGTDFGKEMPAPVGSFISANLTPAGDLSHWSDGEIFRAIRNAVDADGHWLVIMSYTSAGMLSDDDIRALIAYIRSQPAAGQRTMSPPDELNLLGLLMLGAGILPAGAPVYTGAIAAPPKGPTVQYGEYVVSYLDCRTCHGPNLTGGVAGQLAPIGPDLRLVRDWALEDFISTMRSGTDPNGHELKGQMPWREIGKLEDEELGAVQKYLTQLFE